jgi:hypothetical protein
MRKQTSFDKIFLKNLEKFALKARSSNFHYARLKPLPLRLASYFADAA